MSAQSDSSVVSPVKSSRLFQSMKGSFSASSSISTNPAPSTPSTISAPLDVVSAVNEVAQDLEVPETVTEEAPAVTEELTQVLHQRVDTLNPPNAIGGGTAKEAPMLNISVERPAVDVVPGMQQVEVERAHEMPPEVEGFLKTVEDNHDQVPQEIVISNPQTGQALPRVMAQPVIVLPLTPQMEDEGKKKPPNFSVRWLIEWSWKVMKVFSGKVVYRKM